jgi:hypothetical protein
MSAPESEASHGQFSGQYRKALNKAGIALWPAATSNAKATPDYNEAGNSAGQVTQREILLGLWPAATSTDHKGPNPLDRPVCDDDLPTRVARMALWPANQAKDWKSGAVSPETLDRNSRPVNEIALSVWSALRSTDVAKGGPNMSFGAGGSPLPSQVYRTATSSSSAPTASGAGSLHPEFAGWEMGYPPEYISCAPSETASTRRSRRKS